MSAFSNSIKCLPIFCCYWQAKVLCETKTFYVFTILGHIVTYICANADLLKIECHSSWISLTITCSCKKSGIGVSAYFTYQYIPGSTKDAHGETCARNETRSLETKYTLSSSSSPHLSSFSSLCHTFTLTLTITVRIFRDPFCDIGKMVSIYFLGNGSE
jgi:hypothetical protein